MLNIMMTLQTLQFHFLSLRPPVKLCIVGMLLILTACTSTSVPDQADFESAMPTSQLEGDEEMLQALLARGSLAESPQKQQLLYQAALVLGNLKRDEEALQLLETLDTDDIPLPLATNILLQQARLYADLGRSDSALQTLTTARLEQLPRLDNATQMSIRLYRAELYSESGRFLESAIERILVDHLLPLNMVPLNHEQIWNALTALEARRLGELAQTDRRFEFQGWFELAVIGKAYQYNLDRKVVELGRWRNSWNRHPAAVYMPQAMQLVETMAQERPDTIALLLPLDSVSGTVIRDGFLSAYYDVMQFGGKVPKLLFYNTSNSTDILQDYNQAISNGAQMIIGPLGKQHVARLHNESSLPVPTLALNNVEGSRPYSNKLYQFALSPENEAVQIAERAWHDGHRYAAILSPAPSGDNFYQRKRDSFIDHWLSLGGQIVTQEVYRQDYTGIVETLLNIDESEARKNSLERLINEDLAFTQRRRQDIDFIFLIAQPGPARQINPTLAYLYAGDIPVYASQDVYSGIPRPLEDNDLNGIIFGDSPWLLNFNDELKTKATNLFPQNNALTLRLQAFGIDAFRLYPRLRQLEDIPDSQIYGATGLLKLGDNRNIIRELNWAKVSEGLARVEAAGQ